MADGHVEVRDAECLAALERRDDISRQIQGLLTAWLKNDDPAFQDLFTARWEALWVDHHAAALRYEELNGLVSPELADLRWRDYRAFFTSVARVDPVVPLTDSERATLERLEAAHLVKLDDRRAGLEKGKEKTLSSNPSEPSDD